MNLQVDDGKELCYLHGMAVGQLVGTLKFLCATTGEVLLVPKCNLTIIQASTVLASAGLPYHDAERVADSEGSEFGFENTKFPNRDMCHRWANSFYIIKQKPSTKTFRLPRTHAAQKKSRKSAFLS